MLRKSAQSREIPSAAIFAKCQRGCCYPGGWPTTSVSDLVKHTSIYRVLVIGKAVHPCVAPPIEVCSRRSTPVRDVIDRSILGIIVDEENMEIAVLPARRGYFRRTGSASLMATRLGLQSWAPV